MKRLALCIALASLAGCQSVEPWQREVLAQPSMAVTALPRQAARTGHVQASREAGASATAAGGGGCGCY